MYYHFKEWSHPFIHISCKFYRKKGKEFKSFMTSSDLHKYDPKVKTVGTFNQDRESKFCTPILS